MKDNIKIKMIHLRPTSPKLRGVNKATVDASEKMKRRRNFKKTLVRFLEKELILVLAIVVMLGILIGYSLAAALRTTPEITTLSPNAPAQDSLMRAGLEEDNS